MSSNQRCNRCKQENVGAKIPLGWDMVPVYRKQKKGQVFFDMIHLCPDCKKKGARLSWDPPRVIEP